MAHAVIPEFGPAAEQIDTWIRQHNGRLEVACRELFNAVQQFLAETNDSNQEQAQQGWHRCYLAWNQGLLLQQSGLTLNDSDNLQQQRRRINVRPFQPGYIDALPDYPYSGLIHETGLRLSLSVLVEQHQMLDLESAALGFPALETLLWQTPVSRYWLDDDDADSPESRRKAFLLIASNDLDAQLQLNQARWVQGSFRALPDSVQAAWFWQSALRLARADLHQFAFTPDATLEPLWHHPSWVTGNGRDFLVARLAPLLHLLSHSQDDENPLRQWLDRARLGVSAAELDESLQLADAALRALPAQYPENSTDNAAVAQAQSALAGLVEQLQEINTGLGH